MFSDRRKSKLVNISSSELETGKDGYRYLLITAFRRHGTISKNIGFIFVKRRRKLILEVPFNFFFIKKGHYTIRTSIISAERRNEVNVYQTGGNVQRTTIIRKRIEKNAGFTYVNLFQLLLYRSEKS